MEPREAEKV